MRGKEVRGNAPPSSVSKDIWKGSNPNFENQWAWPTGGRAIPKRWGQPRRMHIFGSDGGRGWRDSLTSHGIATSILPKKRIPRPGQTQVQKTRVLRPPPKEKKSGGSIRIVLAVTACRLDPLCYLPSPRSHMPLEDYSSNPPDLGGFVKKPNDSYPTETRVT